MAGITPTNLQFLLKYKQRRLSNRGSFDFRISSVLFG